MVERITSVLPRVAYDYEIIVRVRLASADRTGAVADELAGSIRTCAPCITRDLGYGGA